MISRFTRIACAFALVFSGFAVTAELKIAVVNVSKAVFDSEEAIKGLEKLENELAPERDELEALNQDIISLRDQLQKDRDIMSSDEQREIQNDIENKQLDLEFGVQKLQKQFQDDRDKLFQTIGPKFQAVLDDLIQLEGYDIVFNKNQQVVLYVNTKHDITRKVTERLNQKSTSAD